MTVKASSPVRTLDLVAPLAHEATAMRIPGNRRPPEAGLSGAVSPLIGHGLRECDVDSATRLATPTTRTSTTATRTTTTRERSSLLEPSADPDLFHRLFLAYLDCRRTKRNSDSARAFEARLESNLSDLHDELAEGTYRPGRSICFVITRPRPREVWAAEFRDRVVHWLLYNHIAPRFHARFSADSCACIPGRGTLYAARRLEGHVRSITHNWARPAAYLKADLANFFVSIDKPLLFGLLARHIHEPWWLRLTETVLMHDPREDYELRGPTHLLARVPPHKRLADAPAHRGLPIGNLSSQFFANVLLNRLDQHVNHQLRARYIRYVDDFVLLHESPAWLAEIYRHLQAWLPEQLQLQVNPSKTIQQPIARGIDFVGQVVRPWHRTPRPRTVRQAMHRLEQLPTQELHASINSVFGTLRQASHSHGLRADLANLARRRGLWVAADATKAFIPKGAHCA